MARIQNAFVITALFFATRIWAVSSLPLDPSMFGDFNSLLTEKIANTLLLVVGTSADHRPFEPATPLLWSNGTMRAGVDMSAEVTLARIPEEFSTALKEAGLGDLGSIPPVLPVPRIHIHKGITQNVDIGGSFIGYRGYRLVGADLKIALNSPADEGPTYAIRFCYTNFEMGLVHGRTLTPQVLLSRNMEFADPYLGIGYEWTSGRLEIPIPNPLTGETLVTLTQDGKARAFMAFLGVSLRFVPFRLTLEGAYNSGGAHTIGTKVGFNF